MIVATDLNLEEKDLKKNILKKRNIIHLLHLLIAIQVMPLVVAPMGKALGELG